MKENKPQQAPQQMMFTDAELSTIKHSFADNETLLKLLRKVFLPTYDYEAPLGQVIDLWMTVDIKDKNPDDAIIELKARNLLINHVEQQLIKLRFLAGQKSESVEETKERLMKNSTQ